MIFDLTQGKKPSNGWVHFKCPMCPTRGMGPDTGAHLGIHTTSRGVHCWRCGARALTKEHQVVGWGYRTYENPVAKEIPPKHSWKRLPQAKRESPWGKQDPWQQHGEWIETPRGPAILMPFAETDGYQIRYTDGEQPKVRNFGLKGPAWVRHNEPNPRDRVLVVEGWADSLGFLLQLDIIALLGTDNYRKVPDMVKGYGGVSLALDNDTAGMGARDALTRLLLQRHYEVRWADYEGKDPAEATSPIEWVQINSLTDMRKFDACKTAQA